MKKCYYCNREHDLADMVLVAMKPMCAECFAAYQTASASPQPPLLSGSGITPRKQLWGYLIAVAFLAMPFGYLYLGLPLPRIGLILVLWVCARGYYRWSRARRNRKQATAPEDELPSS